jgi:hypothetical protein
MDPELRDRGRSSLPLSGRRLRLPSDDADLSHVGGRRRAGCRRLVHEERLARASYGVSVLSLAWRSRGHHSSCMSRPAMGSRARLRQGRQPCESRSSPMILTHSCHGPSLRAPMVPVTRFRTIRSRGAFIGREDSAIRLVTFGSSVMDPRSSRSPVERVRLRTAADSHDDTVGAPGGNDKTRASEPRKAVPVVELRPFFFGPMGMAGSGGGAREVAIGLAMRVHAARVAGWRGGGTSPGRACAGPKPGAPRFGPATRAGQTAS